MPGYIPDGFSEKGYLAERPRQFQAIRFKYRPFTLPERYASEEAFRNKKPEDQARVTFALLAKKIVSWDLRAKPDDAVPLPITTETMARLNTALALALFNVIAGYVTSDADPSDVETTAEGSDTVLEEIFTGKPIGDIKAEADAKN